MLKDSFICFVLISLPILLVVFSLILPFVGIKDDVCRAAIEVDSRDTFGKTH